MEKEELVLTRANIKKILSWIEKHKDNIEIMVYACSRGKNKWKYKQYTLDEVKSAILLR